MQGISGPSYSQLCLALNNAADGRLRLARRVKINEIKLIIILFICLVFAFTSQNFTSCCI